MKSQKSPPLDLDTIMPLLIQIWRRFTKERGPDDRLQTREFRRVVEAVKTLKHGLEVDKSLSGTDYFNNPDLLGAYLLYQWVVHYQEAMSILGELPTPPKTVLDLCSGPMPMSFAALRYGAQDVTAVDRNERALTLGAEVCGRYGMPVKTVRGNCLNNPKLYSGKYDLIFLGYALEELFPANQKGWQQAQHEYLKQLLNLLTPEGHLIFIEGSMGDQNQRVLRIREEFVREGVPVQAPCVWRGECPALSTPNSPCYAQREFEKPYLIKEIQRAASINLSSLKMSYLILRHPQSGWPALPDHPLYRVISPAIESFHGKSFYLCGTDGKKRLSSRLEEHPKEARAFDYLKRGELISISGTMDAQNQMTIVEGTHIKVEAALGKPLPQTTEGHDS